MNLKQFKYVLVLADEGSFSKAAETLGIKQPSLSQYIKKIEQEVGSELFDRSGGNVRLTDAGKSYIIVGRKMLDLEHQLEEQLSDLSENKTGTITVGVSAHRSVALMPEIVKEFKKLYPGIVLRIEELKRYEIIDAAEHGEFDLCITTLPVDDKIFNYEVVMVEENVLAVPEKSNLSSESMPGRKFPAVSAESLNGQSFAMLNEEHLMQRQLEELCCNYNLRLKPEVICTSLEALLEMVRIGIGFAFIPSCLAVPMAGVKYFSIKEETNRREIIMMHRKEQYLSKAVLDLMTVIKDALSRM